MSSEQCSLLAINKVSMAWVVYMYLYQTCSDISKSDSSFEVSRLVVEVWDWDRYSSNDLIGGFSIPIPEIAEWSKDGNTVSNWYRLMDAKMMKHKYEHIIENSDAEKV